LLGLALGDAVEDTSDDVVTRGVDLELALRELEVDLLELVVEERGRVDLDSRLGGELETTPANADVEPCTRLQPEIEIVALHQLSAALPILRQALHEVVDRGR